NGTSALLTSKVLLVPYSTHHVLTYHEWMKDEELQQATASEPLTIDEEYGMQRSWRQDADKLTFITCTAPAGSPSEKQQIIKGTKDDTPATMIGDVNLFLYLDADDEEEEAAANAAASAPRPVDLVGEVEIMVASRAHQGRGYGKAILAAFLGYVRQQRAAIAAEYAGSLLPQQRPGGVRLAVLRVKIGAENARSLHLFEGLGFVRVADEPNFFGELELRM
ncbi:uncharacterized protein K452DRAFT_195129, partial [Aplosporella prunicola CBS 121167]